MENIVKRRPDWMGLPVIATVARLLCREITLQNEYLRLENRILHARGGQEGEGTQSHSLHR